MSRHKGFTLSEATRAKMSTAKKKWVATPAGQAHIARLANDKRPKPRTSIRPPLGPLHQWTKVKRQAGWTKARRQAHERTKKRKARNQS